MTSRYIVILWQRYGPYHHARLKGAKDILSKKGWVVEGLEVAGKDQYAWINSTKKDVTVRTLFPDRVYGSLNKREIDEAVNTMLEQASPSAVAINGWATQEALAAMRWCTRHRRMAVLMSETYMPSGAWYKEIVKKYRVRNCQSALVGGRWHREYLSSLGFNPDKIYIGYDAVDNKYFSDGAEIAKGRAEEIRGERGLPQRYFFANTRFLARKNIDGLLRAFALSRDKGSGAGSWDLVISGNGEKEKEWKGLASRLNLADAVHWPGFVQYSDLPAYYGLAGAFIHPARKEAWGLVVNEAAAAGLPLIVAESVGSTCELVRQGDNGYLFKADDIESLARILKNVEGLSDYQRHVLGTKSREIAAGYGPERFGNGLSKALAHGKSQ